MRTLYAFIAAFLFLSSAHAVGGTAEQELEKGLIDALRLDKKTSQRIGNSGKAIQAYMREGLVNRKPNKRADYTDYYVLNKPAKLMGHELVMIEEEYLTRYVGCCVNPGIGVTVKVAGATGNLEKFAKDNGCRFVTEVPLQEEIRAIGIRMTIPPGEYATLSCRERDAIR